MRVPRRIRCAHAAIALCACAALACTSTTKNIEGDDGSSLAIEARARIPIRRETARGSRPPESPREMAGEVWVDVLHTAGEDSQDLALNEQISFHDALFVGPERVSSTLTASSVRGTAALRGELSETLRLAALVGLSFVRRELELRSPSSSVDDTTSFLGPAYGVELEIGDREAHARFYAGFHGTLAFGSGGGLDTRTVEVGVGWRFDEHFAARAGLRYTKWLESPNRGASDVDYVLSGPMISLEYGW